MMYFGIQIYYETEIQNMLGKPRIWRMDVEASMILLRNNICLIPFNLYLVSNISISKMQSVS